ncbi:MAG: GAF domain-containing sensor histidine kinase [Cyclobacteriaceae bacterium]|nr:GAF domain-containing sensor histidine kinase [Cyclobacteriaceae bacterium]MCH8515625.1 GAF domain-containing sensor histidine kinase [Cyclobacteriaceae bacterium]
MVEAKEPHNEQARLDELKNYLILDTPEEEIYDDIVQLAAQICDVPIALISIIDNCRQWFKSRVGLDVKETDKRIAFCSHAILTDTLMIVEDALEDERFIDNPLVTGPPYIRFYAGFPLKSKNGFNLGTLCVIDTKPKKINEAQQFALRTLAKQVMQNMEVKLMNIELQQHFSQAEKINAELHETLQTKEKMLSIISHDLRSPLSSIVQLTELMRQNASAEWYSIVDEMSKGSRNALALLDNLVDWASNAKPSEEIKFERLNLYTLIHKEVNFMKSQLKRKNIDLDLKISAFTAYGNKDFFRFIIRNLLYNALKFTEDGQIRLWVVDEKEHTKITIIDTGVGTDIDINEHLKLGKKVNSQKGTNGEIGSGLGLSVVHEFVRKMKGEIDFKSKKGTGMEVNIYFPHRKIDR